MLLLFTYASNFASISGDKSSLRDTMPEAERCVPVACIRGLSKGLLEAGKKNVPETSQQTFPPPSGRTMASFTLVDYVRYGNVTQDSSKWLHRPWLHPATSFSHVRSRSDAEKKAHDNAIARIAKLLGPELGECPRNVGDIHYPLHMRAKHAEAIVGAREGGPGAYEVPTPTLLAARYRPHAGPSNRAAPFPTALRYGTVKEARLNHEFQCALKGITSDPLKPKQPPQKLQLPTKVELKGKEEEEENEETDDWRDVKLCDDEKPFYGGKHTKLEVEGDEWEGVEVEEERADKELEGEEKELERDGSDIDKTALNESAETPPSKTGVVLAATHTADMSEAEKGAKKLAAKLRAIGKRRALEAVIYGKCITPTPGEASLKVETPQGKLKWRG